MSGALVDARDGAEWVCTARELLAGGMSRGQLATEVRVARWRRGGLAIIRHNGPLTVAQRRQVALVHAGPTALLTAFTAAEVLGLRGWERDDVHVLAPGGTRLRPRCPVPVRLYLHGPKPVCRLPHRRIEALPAALIRAAGTFPGARPACGLLAAGVQQRLVTPDDLENALAQAPRVRHRHALLDAVRDIAGGAQALSEIDFVRICRRHGLPLPERQVPRSEPDGRRRYLDAAWRRSDGRLVVVEVDGALHLVAARWWDDQLRQNELALADALVLRFPSAVVRHEERRVVEQLRRALHLG